MHWRNEQRDEALDRAKEFHRLDLSFVTGGNPTFFSAKAVLSKSAMLTFASRRPGPDLTFIFGRCGRSEIGRHEPRTHFASTGTLFTARALIGA
jgi:hypothetical protein